jgi:hypothetical protein
LAYCRPGHRWSAHLVTAIGGPMVNVVICIAAGLTLGLWTGIWWGVAIPNPLNLNAALDPIVVSQSHLLQTLVIFHSMSLILLLFNLLPIFPLDGGRIVQSSIWPKHGYNRSMVFAVRTGYVGAILLGIFGAVMSMWMVVGIAVFGGITCYITQKQLQFTNDMLSLESDEYAMSVHLGGGEADDSSTPPRQTRAERRALRQAQRDQQESEEVDRILQKIADSGIDSLTRGERMLLARVTERKRRSQQ